MRKLLKSLACFATAALVGASALAGYGWYGGAMSIGGTTTDCTAWHPFSCCCAGLIVFTGLRQPTPCG